MIDILIQLTILFAVIIDPPLSFAVFVANTKTLDAKEKAKIAGLAILVAALIGYVFLLFGENILHVLSTEINDFRVAGGIILVLLGIRMALGQTVANIENGNSSKAIASIIATPLISGPSCITALIINSVDYGQLLTGIAFTIIIVLTGALLFLSIPFEKHINTTAIKVATTIMGLITIAWGVEFIRVGLGI